MKIPNNKYTKMLLRIIKELDLAHYLDENQLDKMCYREGFINPLNSIEGIVDMPDMFLSLDTPEALYEIIEKEYHNKIKENIIYNVHNIIEKEFKKINYDAFNTDTIDYKIKFKNIKSTIFSMIEKNLYKITDEYFYYGIFREYGLTQDVIDPILDKIMRNIKYGTIE